MYKILMHKRYVDSEDCYALLRAWHCGIDVGAWRGLDQDAFEKAVRSYLMRIAAENQITVEAVRNTPIEIERIEYTDDEMLEKRCDLLRWDTIDWPLYEAFGGSMQALRQEAQAAGDLEIVAIIDEAI